LDQAIEQYRLAAKSQPEFSDARINLANLLMRSGQMLDAEIEVQEVVRQAPTNVAAWGALSSIQLELGKINDAKTSAESAIDADPNSDKAFLNLAIVYKYIGDLDQALELITKTISLNPDNAHGYYNRALINFLRGIFSQAIEEYEFRWSIDSSSAIWRKYPYPVWQPGDKIEGKKIF
jgi:tetratricopeptide (TPR) repeat protein